MLGETGGCEPEFAISYTRRTVGMTENEDHYYKVYCKCAREYMELNNTESLPDYFVSSSDIDPIDRVTTQAVMQNYVDTAISSTINLPEDVSENLMEEIYLEAWKQGLKGLTIFRNNCKKMGILTTDTPSGKGKENEVQEILSEDSLPRGAIIECSDNLIGMKRKLQTGCGSLHVTGFFDEGTGQLMEVYLSKGSTGGCNNFMIGLSRMISLLCRAGVDIYTIKDQLDSAGACPSYAIRSAMKHDTSKGSCCPMAIGNALIDMYKEFNAKFIDETDDSSEAVADNSDQSSNKDPEESVENNSQKCPSCGSSLRHEGGCIVCPECGWSKCD